MHQTPSLLSRIQLPPVAETVPFLSSALPDTKTDLAKVASDLHVAKSSVTSLSLCDFGLLAIHDTGHVAFLDYFLLLTSLKPHS